MKNVLIVEDHIMIVMSLKLMLHQLDEEIQVTDVGGFDEAMRHVSTQSFDLIILDILIPGGKGAQMISLIKEKLPSVIILVCSSIDEEQNAERYLTAGADGFLSKLASKPEVLSAISTLMNGHKYVSAKVHQKLLNEAFGFTVPSNRLSPRETEVMNLILDGKWTKEIGRILNISVSTVSTLKSRIFEKMQVDSVAGLVMKINSGEIEKVLS